MVRNREGENKRDRKKREREKERDKERGVFVLYCMMSGTQCKELHNIQYM